MGASGGSNTATASTPVVDEVHATTTSVNNVVDTPMCALTIPTTVALGDILRLSAGGDYLNNSGSGVTYLHKIKVGTTTVLTSVATSAATGTGRRMWVLDCMIYVESVTAQRVHATILGTSPAAGAETFIGQTAGTSVVGYGTAAENLAVAKTVSYTVTMGTANALADFRLHAASLTHLRKT